MARYADTVYHDQAERQPYAGVQVVVRNAAAPYALAAITDDNGGAIVGSAVSTDNLGSFAFNATSGSYLLQYLIGGTITRQQNIVIGQEDSSAVDFLQSGTGAVARSVQEKLRSFIDVKDFGAKGDGTTNDTAALQAAISAGDVYLPVGTYRITANLSIPSNRRIYGPGTIKIIDDGSAQAIQLDLNGVSNVVIEGLSIFSTATARTGVYGNIVIRGGSSNIEIRNCDLGVSSSTAVWSGGESSNIRVLNCLVHDTKADGLHFTRGCTDVLVEGCEVYSTGDDGIAFVGYCLEGATPRPIMQNCRAVGNTVRNNVGAGSGIVFLGVDGGQATANSVHNTYLNGISVSVDKTNSAAETHHCRNIVVRDNEIAAVSTGGVGFGIAIVSARGVTLAGNRIKGGTYDALNVSGVCVDLNVTGGSYGEEVSGRCISIAQTASSDARLIQELFTDYGETVTEGRSRDIKIETALVAPGSGHTIQIAGESGKLIKGVQIRGTIPIRKGGANNGINLLYCDRPLVEDAGFVPFGTGSVSTGSAINFSACSHPRVRGGCNDGAASTGVSIVSGSTDFDVVAFQSESGAIGIFCDDNAAKGLVDQCWLRSNTTAARQGTGGATLGTNVEA